MKLHDPPLTFRDEDSKEKFALCLKNNSEGYGFAIVRFASEWATRMEAIAKDHDMSTLASQIKFMAEHADKISHEADDEGITGFMYGKVVAILAGCWIYGEAFRRWHNKDTQINDEGDCANETGGVLNPAVLTLH